MEGKIEINALTSKMPREFPARIMLSGSAWLVYQQFEYLSAKADAHSTSLLNPANSSKTDKSPQMRRAGGSTPCPSQPLPAHSSCKEVTSGDIPSRSHPAKQSICATHPAPRALLESSSARVQAQDNKAGRDGEAVIPSSLLCLSKPQLPAGIRASSSPTAHGTAKSTHPALSQFLGFLRRC